MALYKVLLNDYLVKYFIKFDNELMKKVQE